MSAQPNASLPRPPSRTSNLVRFGPFEVDRVARELRKNGKLVKLQDKQFRLLLELLEQPTEVVTRTELHEALWPDTEYGEFDIGLNQAVRRLRRALGDSAREPDWIETIPTVGYRFLAEPVPATPPLPAAHPEKSNGIPQGPRERTLESRWSLLAVGTVAALAAGLAAGLVWFRERPSASPYDPSRMTEVALTNEQGREIYPSFSPDGSHLAYSYRRRDEEFWNLFIRPVGSDRSTQVTDSPFNDMAPAWSPDGRSLAFIRRASMMSDAALLVMPAYGGPVDEIAAIECRNTLGLRVDWSPDGRKLLFAGRDGPTGPLRIGMVDRETRESTWLTDPPSEIGGDSFPAFSPDGSAVAFVRREGSGGRGKLFTLRLSSDFATTAAPEPLAELHGTLAAPVWAPDGDSILFVGADSPGREGIWSIGVQPFAEPQLIWRASNAMTEDRSLAVRRNRTGQTLVAYTFRAPRDVDIYRVPLRGPARGQPERLISTSHADALAVYSPDGKQIAFQTGALEREIWVASADGDNRRRLAGLDSRADGPLSWSPTGRKIAFRTRRSGSVANIYTVDVETAKVEQLTNGAEDRVQPVWSRDGRSIYFLSLRQGDWGVWKMPAAGGPEEFLFKGRLPTFAESLDGKTLYANDTVTGDFLAYPLDQPEPRSEVLLPEASKALAAFHVAESGLFFVKKTSGSDSIRRASDARSAPGMLCRLDPLDGAVEELFEVRGQLTSIAPDESAVLLSTGPEYEIDLKLLIIEPADEASTQSD